MQSRLLNKFPGIVHGYSVRSDGDMRSEIKRAIFLDGLGIASSDITMPKQVHGTQIGIFGDGLVARGKGKAIGVIVADCVPMLLVDAKKSVVAAVHAGWKGTLGNIAAKAVKEMKSDPHDIFVSIGPHIGSCCYTVPQARADSFSSQCTYYDGANWHLDIGLANRMQLIEAGIPAAHIDAPVFCTSCQVDRFYSYRKDTKESFGEILAVIAVQ